MAYKSRIRTNAVPHVSQNLTRSLRGTLSSDSLSLKFRKRVSQRQNPRFVYSSEPPYECLLSLQLRVNVLAVSTMLPQLGHRMQEAGKGLLEHCVLFARSCAAQAAVNQAERFERVVPNLHKVCLPLSLSPHMSMALCIFCCIWTM
jgi:hypothetical protein